MFLILLSICRFGDFSLSKLLIFLNICRFCALLASKCWFCLSICRFGEPQVFQTYIFATKKQKRRIDTIDMFFLFKNFPDEKEIHKMFIYNEHFLTTLSMIIDTFKRGIKHKELLDRHCKAHCRDPDMTLKTIKKNIRYVTVSPHKITYANFPLKQLFILKGRPWGGGASINIIYIYIYIHIYIYIIYISGLWMIQWLSSEPGTCQQICGSNSRACWSPWPKSPWNWHIRESFQIHRSIIVPCPS